MFYSEPTSSIILSNHSFWQENSFTVWIFQLRLYIWPDLSGHGIGMDFGIGIGISMIKILISVWHQYNIGMRSVRFGYDYVLQGLQ